MTIAVNQSRINWAVSGMEDSQPNHLPFVGSETQDLYFESARNLLLTWVELFKLSEEEVKGLVARMVGRGEVTEQQGQQIIDHIKYVREQSDTHSPRKARPSVF